MIVNNKELISDVEHLTPLGKSDHEVLSFKLYLADKHEAENIELYFDMKNGNFSQMRSELKELDWSILPDLDVENSWTLIKIKFMRLCREISHNAKLKETKMGGSNPNGWVKR